MKQSDFEQALALVRRDQRLKKLTEHAEHLEGIQDIVKTDERLLQKRYDDVLSGPDAEAVLAAIPEAERFLAEEERREQFIEGQTFLGALIEAVRLVGAHVADGIQYTEADVPTPTEVHLEERASTRYEYLQSLLVGLANTGDEKLCEALEVVLGAIKMDVLIPYPEMPPAARYPEFED